MPDSPKPDLTAYIAMLKHEITEHADEEIERMILEIQIANMSHQEIERKKKIREIDNDFCFVEEDKFERIADQLENLSSVIDGLMTEIFKYRMDLKDK